MTSRPPLGVVVPTPTLVSAVAPLTLLILPKMIELLWATCARLPMAVELLMPETICAFEPSRVLLFPVGFAVLKSARVPIKVLPLPVVLLAPVFTPANKLFVPALLNTRLLPILNCVAALTMFPDKVPPATPLPEMLKFAF